MGLSGVNTCLKWLMFVFNLIFFLMGAAILGVGIWLKVEKGGYEDISSYDYATPSNIAIVIGIVMLFVAFLGCFGSIKELRHMLLAYFVLLLIVFILELVVGGLAYAKRDEVEDKLAEEFKNSIRKKYGTDDYPEVTEVIDKFQNEFECCGFDNYTDYRGSTYTIKSLTIPKSCCMKDKKDNPKCGDTDPGAIVVYETKGCYNEVLDFLKYNLFVVGTFAIIFAVIQILGMVFSMVLYCAISKDQKGTLA